VFEKSWALVGSISGPVTRLSRNPFGPYRVVRVVSQGTVLGPGTRKTGRKPNKPCRAGHLKLTRARCFLDFTWLGRTETPCVKNVRPRRKTDGENTDPKSIIYIYIFSSLARYRLACKSVYFTLNTFIVSLIFTRGNGVRFIKYETTVFAIVVVVTKPYITVSD